MNNTQKWIVRTALGLVLLTVLVPPWHVVFMGNGAMFSRFLGHNFVLNQLPPVATVDLVRLVLEWVGILAVGGLAYMSQSKAK